MNRFQNTHTPANVDQNAVRDSAGVRCPTAIAVDSSIVPKAASQRRGPRTPSTGAIRIA